ncbi:MAG: NUDIX hydrolase [Chloroflexota bacterium]
MPKQIPPWLDWAQRIQAIAQSGLTYAKDVYDIERYEQLRALAVEMMAAKLDDDPELIVERFNAQTGYATPKVDVRGVVFQDGKLLLVQERSDMGWTLPGGWCDVGETAAENVVKEVYEESGFLTRAVKLLAVYDNHRHPHVPQSPFETYKFIFRCEIVGGEATTSHETAAVSFFAEDELPANLSGGRVTPYQLKRFFAHYRNPNWPTDFD